MLKNQPECSQQGTLCLSAEAALVYSHRTQGLGGGGLGCWKLEVCPRVHACARVCQRQDLGECVLSSTSALTVYGAQWGMWWGEALEALRLLGSFQTPLGVGP